jgi:pyrroline-5-carboxylate reductase
MILGFIGTGKIASSVITGVCTSKISFQKILISRRNKNIAQKLKKRFRKVNIAKTNQEIVDKCNWIFLAVTPEVGEKILSKLNFRSNQKIISFISTINSTQLKKIVKKKAKIIRALPLPPISLRKGPVPIFPPNKEVKFFFNHLGTAVEIPNEKLFSNFWCMTAMMAPFYENLNTLSEWLSNKGLNKIDAQKYVTSLFFAMSEDAVVNSKKDLRILIKNSQTPGGLNEQALKQLRRSGFYRLLNNAANSILKRLNKV